MQETKLRYSRDTEIDLLSGSGTMASAPLTAEPWRSSDEPRVIGRYALFDEIASGGMGVVHFGRLLGSGGFERVVAIKRGHPGLAADPEIAAMFHEEVRLFSRIRHPNVVAALDVVEDAGELLLVMEYVHGVSLAQLARRAREAERPLPLAIAVTILCQVLRGLHAAHSARSAAGEPLGIVHRDVSPQNVLVGCDGLARILDFGVAKARDSQLRTRAGHVKGKLGYVPPEQIRGGAVDRRSDVYGAAVVLWELLANARLFGTGSAADTIQNVLAGKVPSLSVVAPRGVPAGLEAVVRRGLEVEPSQRFQSARDMAHALEQEMALVGEDELGDWVTMSAKELLAERSRRFAWAENCPVSLPRSSALAIVESLPAEEIVEVPRLSAPSLAPSEPVPFSPPRSLRLRSVAGGLMLASVLGGVALARSGQSAAAATPAPAPVASSPRTAPVEPTSLPAPAPAPEVVALTELALEEPVAKVVPPQVKAPKTTTSKAVAAPRKVPASRSRDGVDDGF